ncbi:hypothetical protein CPB84DRAFT_1794242 [Gymnopilus junonius]|uniref:DUF4470 domain-containing protein n=1 Tax=Gymnopilus junonius TaxID=109634 RepID=A0A9P5NC63_GYMJU|nr:hypothetical protein CPB84DRAFT_1794242 [Gymnopilus junonius]
MAGRNSTCLCNYPSNLSAALFEQGKYPPCISAIHVAWTRLKTQNSIEPINSISPDDITMSVKLATRLAKSKLQGVHSRGLSLHPESNKPPTANQQTAKSIEEDIENFALSHVLESNGKVQEMKSTWEQWLHLQDNCAKHTKKECKILISEAESRLRNLPILKSSSDPTLEFFRVGGILLIRHDQVQLLMNGINGYADDPYSLGVPQYRDKKSWTFLFGGCGDGRHIFGTLIHLAFMSTVNEKEHHDPLTVHMMLVDIHPAMLARVLLDPKKNMELHTTLFYLYTGLVMPEYFVSICKSLVDEISKGTCDLLKYVHINENSMPAILDTVQYWSTPLPKSTKIFLERSSAVTQQSFPKRPGFTSDGSFLEPALLEARSNSQYVRVPSGMSGPYADPDAEYKIFQRLKVLIPPKPLASGGLYAEAAREIEQTWVPNPTLFDQSSTEHPGPGQENGYPRISKPPFETLASFAEFSGNLHRGRPPLSASGNSGFATINFPKDYSRIFLSNVPDYTHGMLNTAVHLVQHLQPNALVMANCLLNSLDFPTLADFCYKNAFDDIALKRLPLPLPFDQLVRPKELHTWLAQLLLCILYNGRPHHPPHRVDLPGNLNTFLNTLVHLQRVGYPPHWIGDFLQFILSDNLVTDVQPYLGTTPIPKMEINRRTAVPRKVHLGAWQAELEVMLALTMPALPFAVSVPRVYPTLSDISTFKATVEPIDLSYHPLAHVWKVLISGVTKAIGLMFYRPTQGIDTTFLARQIPGIIEGERDVRHAQVQIMLSQESVDLLKGEISWKMSQSWYGKMKAEAWCMAAYRTDLKVAASEPASVTEWSKV